MFPKMFDPCVQTDRGRGVAGGCWGGSGGAFLGVLQQGPALWRVGFVARCRGLFQAQGWQSIILTQWGWMWLWRGCRRCEHPWESVGEGDAVGWWVRLEGLTECFGDGVSGVMEELCPGAHVVLADGRAAVAALWWLHHVRVSHRGEQLMERVTQGPHPKGADCPGGRNWGPFAQLQPQEVCDGHRGAAPSDNHGSCFWVSPNRCPGSFHSPCPWGWDPSWVILAPPTSFLGDGEPLPMLCSLLAHFPSSFPLHLY